MHDFLYKILLAIFRRIENSYFNSVIKILQLIESAHYKKVNHLTPIKKTINH